MLKHDDNSQPQALPSAAQVRVTPEELAAAVTVLQIRKEGQPGTIAIGDAVDELGLDVTPEEVLAEVQARRAKPKRVRDYRALACAGLCAAAFASLAIFHSSNTFPTHATNPLTSGSAVPNIVPLHTTTLDDTADSQIVYVDARGLAQVMEKVPSSQIKVSAIKDGYLWGVIKHHGKIYLIGFVSSLSETQMKRSHMTLYSDPPNGYLMSTGEGQVNYTSVTLSVETMQLEDTQMDDYAERIVVSGIHPDSYLWENS